jgi:hypothetical protein
MDDNQFDALVRRLGTSLPRRTAFGALAAWALTISAGGRTWEDALGKSKKKKKKKRKRKGIQIPIPTQVSTGCASGIPPCNGKCLIAGQCCNDGDCGSGKRCNQDNQCVDDICDPVANCAGKNCGDPDGCEGDGKCITNTGCGTGQTCNSLGQCVDTSSCPTGQIQCPGRDFCGAGNCCTAANDSGLLCGEECVHAICCPAGGPAPSSGGSCCGNTTANGGRCCYAEGVVNPACVENNAELCCSGVCGDNFTCAR